MTETTVADIIYKLRAELRAMSDDSKLTNRLIYAVLKDARSELMAQKLNQRKLYKSMEYQPLKCIGFTKTDLSTCCRVPVHCPILKSDSQLPNLIDTNLGLAVRGIYSIDLLGVRITFTTLNQLISKLGSRFPPSTPQAFIFDSSLYIWGVDSPETAFTVDGIWESPEIIWELNMCKGKKCSCDGAEYNCISYLDAPFPYPQYLERAMMDLAKQELQSFFQIKPDTVNDGAA